MKAQRTIRSTDHRNQRRERSLPPAPIRPVSLSIQELEAWANQQRGINQ